MGQIFPIFAALMLSGCTKPVPPVQPVDPEAPITIGWRLVPGMELEAVVETTHTVGEDRAWRIENWRYLIRRMDDHGAVTLEGSLTALDAGLTHEQQPLTPSSLKRAIRTEIERVQSSGVHLRIVLDGTVSSLDATSWDDALGHLLISMALPPEPVQPGMAWPDLAPARAVSALLPSDIGVKLQGEQRFIGVVYQHDRWLAEIAYNGRVTPDDEQVNDLVLWGKTYWDLSRGALYQRELVLTQPGEGGASAEIGALTVELSVELSR